ncbi:MAG: hypothetical protein ABFS39_09390 [Pseudomonadota bacterium]
MRLASFSLLIPFIFLTAQPLQAAEFCTAQPLEHARLKDRSNIMQFSDGRSVTLIGHDHGDRAELRRFSKWLLNPDPELSTDDWKAHVEAFLMGNEKTARQAKDDLGFLRATLWNAKDPIFLAVEAQDDNVAGRIQNAMKVRSALFNEFVVRELDNPGFMRNVELVYMGATLYSNLYDAELMNTYDLVGMEGHPDGSRLQKVGKKAMRVAQARLSQLKNKPDYDEVAVKKAVQFVVDEMNEAYADVAMILVYDHKTIRDQIMGRYPSLDPQVRGTILNYLFGYLDYLRGMKKRDIFFSRKLANQERSGIFLVGEEHLASLTNLLQVQCKTLEMGLPVPEAIPEQEPEQVIEEM